MSSSAGSGAANLVPLRLERSESAASLDTFLPPRNSEFKVGFYYVNLIDIIFMIFYNIFITNVRIKEKIL